MARRCCSRCRLVAPRSDPVGALRRLRSRFRQCRRPPPAACPRLFLAMCVYIREHGKLPASLDELVQANILERVPFDPFSSNHFQYSREHQAIWSVGWDGGVSPAAVADDANDFQNHLWRLDTIK